MATGFSLKKTRQHNISTVLGLILNNGQMARAKISKISGLSPTTCTAATKTLLEHGVIEEVGEGLSNGGRKPILLRVKKDYGCIIGAQRTGESVQFGVFNMAMDLVYSKVVPIQPTLASAFSCIREHLLDVIEESGARHILGLTVSTDGVVDVISGQVIGTSSEGVQEIYELDGFLEGLAPFPVWIENDSNILAFAEKRLVYPDDHSLVHINVGNGIGAGVIIDDEIVRGRYGYMGEIGHISLDRNGPRCYCGNKGCLETMASLRVMNERLKKAKSTKTGVASLIEDEADMLMQGVINVINMYDPEIITLGGFTGEMTERIVERILEKLEKTIYGYELRNRLIRPAIVTENKVLIGAALNSLNRLIKEDIIAQDLT